MTNSQNNSATEIPCFDCCSGALPCLADASWNTQAQADLAQAQADLGLTKEEFEELEDAYWASREF